MLETRPVGRCFRSVLRRHPTALGPVRFLSIDHSYRLSQLWAPSGGIKAADNEDGYAKLVRAGFLRQAHAGIFHMLPLGLRVQEKIQRLIEEHMHRLGASRLEMSTLSSEALWEKSGRLSNVASELFHVVDRKQAPYLLSPTHEEEITTLVARTVKSYRELPLRLYQITRKYRDEFRPRHGLLRGREFVMKDLYTFDLTTASALATYDNVRQAYADIFAELKLPVLVAKANSGSMGGDLSHEYHLPAALGEDHVVSCSGCDYVANAEVVPVVSENSEAQSSAPSGSQCPQCSTGTLKMQKAIELGHTFHLGTRYSEPLDAKVSVQSGILSDMAPSGTTVAVPLQMGCHGIGVTRLIGAIADHLADDKGLNWPLRVAPFEVAILPSPGLDDCDSVDVKTVLKSVQKGEADEAIIDDRDVSLAWKLNDADLVGYPVLVVLGREWKAGRRCEVQCRVLGIRESVKLEDLGVFVKNILEKLS